MLVKKLLLIFGVIFSTFAPIASAKAVDIPLLTWEKGKVQSIVLGTLPSADTWQVRMEGNGKSVVFHSSISNKAGYKVFETSVPSQLKTGQYFIYADNSRGINKQVAIVDLIPLKTHEIFRSPFSLKIVLALFGFLTTGFLTLRKFASERYSISEKYSSLELLAIDRSSQGNPELWVDIARQTEYRLKLIHALQSGFLKSILRKSDDAIYTSNSFAYRFSLTSIFTALGAISLLELFSMRGSLAWFILLGLQVAIGTFDPIAGTTAFLGLTFLVIVQLGSSGIADGLGLIILFSSVALPGYALNAIRFVDSIRARISLTAPLVIGLLLLPTTTWNLYASLQQKPTEIHGLEYLTVCYFGIAIAILFLFLRSRTIGTSQSPIVTNAPILPGGRLMSPVTLGLTSAIYISIFYIWNSNLAWSILAGIVWISPLLVTQIHVRENVLSRLTVSPWISLLLLSMVPVAIFAIAMILDLLPLISYQKANYYLIAAAIPPLLFAGVQLFRRGSNMSPQSEIGAME